MTWLPPGNYRARGVSFEMGLAKTGSQRVHVVCEIAEDEPPHSDGSQQYEVSGVQISWFGTIGSDAASEITFKALWSFTGPDAWDGDLLKLEDVISTQQVELVIDDDDYAQGAPRSKVKFVNVPGSGGARLGGMDDNEKRAFAAQMRGKALAYRPGAGRPSNKPGAPASRNAPPRSPAPTTPTSTGGNTPGHVPSDDDIPF